MNDRRDISPLLLAHYPFMADASSDEWQAFLNEKTGCHITAEPNSTAFDTWRKALAKQHDLPVWGYTSQTVENAKAKGLAMIEKEKKWRDENPEKAAELDAAIKRYA